MIGSKILRQIMKLAFQVLSDDSLREVIILAVSSKAQKLPPSEGLKFLFRLDEAFYTLQGRMAVAYGGGVHTKHCHIRYHDFFVHRINPGEKVLDVGCGNGVVAYDIAMKAGAHVKGIDISAENIAIAKSRYSHPNVSFDVGDALKSLPKGSFNAVVLSNFLEHVDQRVEFLRRLVEGYQPTRLLLRVPVFERDWRVPLKKELGVDYRLDSGHFTEYTLESFASEMEAAGLKIIHQEIRWSEIWAEVAEQ